MRRGGCRQLGQTTRAGGRVGVDRVALAFGPAGLAVGPVHFHHHDALPPQVATQLGAVSAGAFHAPSWP